MAISSPYITDAEFQQILADLNVESMQAADQQAVVDRAGGDLEAALCGRFVVPLTPLSGTWPTNAPTFSVQKVKNAMRAKVRSVIALDKHRNLTFAQGETFKNLHEGEFRDHVKDLLDPTRVYGLMLNRFATGALEPAQSIGLARPDDRLHIVPDWETPLP